MNDFCRVGRSKRAGDFGANSCSHKWFDAPRLLQAFGEGLSAEEFQNEKRIAVGCFADIVNSYDIAMGEFSTRPRFTEQALAQFRCGVSRPGADDELEGDFSAGEEVFPGPDFAHRAFANLLGKTILVDQGVAWLHP